MDSKCSVSSDGVIFLELWLVDGQPVEKDCLWLTVAAVKLSPTGYGVLFDEFVVCDNSLYWLNVTRESELFFVDFDVNSGVAIRRWQRVTGCEGISEIISVTNE